MTTTDLIALLAEAQTEIINLSDDNNNVAQRIGKAMEKTTTTFYATFGSGQPGYPGYLQVDVQNCNPEEAACEAHRRVTAATGGKWCGLYSSLDAMHDADKVFRGKA